MNYYGTKTKVESHHPLVIRNHHASLDDRTRIEEEKGEEEKNTKKPFAFFVPRDDASLLSSWSCVILIPFEFV